MTLVEREILLDIVGDYQIYKEHLLTQPEVREDQESFSQIQREILYAKELRSILLNPIEWN